MRIRQLEERLVEKSKENAAKAEQIINQINLAETRIDILQIESHLKSLVDDADELRGMSIRLRNVESDSPILSQIDVLIAAQDKFINETAPNQIATLYKHLATIESTEREMESLENTKNQTSKKQDSLAPSILAGVGLGLLSALTKQPKISTPKRPKHTSGTKTGRKRSR